MTLFLTLPLPPPPLADRILNLNCSYWPSQIYISGKINPRVNIEIYQVKPNQTKPNQTKPNQAKPNQTKLNQTKPNQTKPNQTTPNQTKLCSCRQVNPPPAVEMQRSCPISVSLGISCVTRGVGGSQASGKSLRKLSLRIQETGFPLFVTGVPGIVYKLVYLSPYRKFALLISDNRNFLITYLKGFD